MLDVQPLKGKVAVVTGAGGGIGRAYSRGLADAGASVVLADIAVDAALATASDLERDGHAALAVEADVTDEASVNAMAQAAVERFGSIDILVNNAALMAEIMGRPLTTIPMQEWHRTLAVNLTGPWLCTRAVAFLPSQHYGITSSAWSA